MAGCLALAAGLQRHRVFRSAAVLFVLVVGAAVLLSGEPPQQSGLRGYLYFASGSHLGRFDLRDGRSSVVADFGSVNIDHVSPHDAGRILLTASGPINGRLVSRAIRWDPETGERRSLFSAEHARFVAGAGHVVFERNAELYSIGVGDNAAREVLIHARAGGHSFHFVALANDHLLYIVPNAGAPLIRLRNILSFEETPLPRLSEACRLRTAIWIEARQRLVCRRGERNAGTFAVVTLSGQIEDELALSDGHPAQPLAYLREHNTLIYTVREPRWHGGRERTSVWAYDFASRQSARLSPNQFLGSSVAFAPF